jgi:hypothetical protein
MKNETKTIIDIILNMISRKKEQEKTLKEIYITATAAIEALKYKVFEENTPEQIIKEAVETATKTTCYIFKHPSTPPTQIVSTPTIKITNTTKTQTLTCTQTNQHDETKLSITFTIETYEIQTPTTKYTIITDVKELKPNH